MNPLSSPTLSSSDSLRAASAPLAVHWGFHPFPQSEVTTWTLGPLVVCGRCVGDELWLAHAHREAAAVLSFRPGGSAPMPAPLLDAPPFDSNEWSRWVLKGRPETLQFKPVFPDLPVVVKPEYPFRILPAASARIFVRVPVWLKIIAGEQDVVEIPVAVLSNTWFGDPTEGELCYWVSSSARREAHYDPDRAFQAICPILIVNASMEELPVEKICLRVPSLTMFLNDKQLWSDETTVRFRGLDAGSEAHPSGQPPAQAPGAKQVSGAREPIHHGFASRSFTTLIDMTGLGFKTEQPKTGDS